MVDLFAEDSAPQQAPTVSELEEARADVEKARQVALKWLMAAESARRRRPPGRARQPA